MEDYFYEAMFFALSECCSLLLHVFGKMTRLWSVVFEKVDAFVRQSKNSRRERADRVSVAVKIFRIFSLIWNKLMPSNKRPNASSGKMESKLFSFAVKMSGKRVFFSFVFIIFLCGWHFRVTQDRRKEKNKRFGALARRLSSSSGNPNKE